MTNEEAIEWLKDEYEHARCDECIEDEYVNALEMAIKALKEPQPTKPRPITSEGAYVLDIESGQVMTAGEYQRRQSKAQGDGKSCLNCIYKDRGAFEKPCEVCTRDIGFRDKWKGVADE